MKNKTHILFRLTFVTLFMFMMISSCKDSGTGPETTDTIAPTVVLTTPANNAVDITHDQQLIIEFSEEMLASSINASSFTFQQGSTDLSGAIAYANATATFTPSELLNENLVYTATINTNAKDLAGNSLEAAVVWSFTAAANPDEAAPTVLTVSPTDNATGIERNKLIEITFSEEMDAATITDLNVILTQGSTPVTGVVSYQNSRATFTPNGPLGASLDYSAKVTTSVTDLAGNPLANEMIWSFTTGGQVQPLAPVNLGAAENYVILAKSAISNNPTSAITGDLGISPAAETYITGFSLIDATGYATSSQVTGQVFAADMAAPTPTNLTTAVNNMQTAYTDAAGRSLPDFVELYTGDLSGKTLTPGLYKWTTTVTMASDVILSGGPTDVWIFQIDGDLSMSSAVNITLTGGALNTNVFWQVAGEAVIGANAHFEGIILSMTGITLQTGASLNGRMLAQTAVILDGNTVVNPQ